MSPRPTGERSPIPPSKSSLRPSRVGDASRLFKTSIVPLARLPLPDFVMRSTPALDTRTIPRPHTSRSTVQNTRQHAIGRGFNGLPALFGVMKHQSTQAHNPEIDDIRSRNRAQIMPSGGRIALDPIPIDQTQPSRAEQNDPIGIQHGDIPYLTRPVFPLECTPIFSVPLSN